MIDLIDRRAAIDAADRTDYLGLAVEDVKKVTDEVVKELKKSPSIQPKRGHWVGGDDEPCEVYECDVCGAVYDTVVDTRDLPNYCPNCGAQMENGGEDAFYG